MVIICKDKYANDAKYASYFGLYPFPLSDFQKYAIEAIVEKQHVLVTAHTGSGKTLPAEFAIQHFVGQGKKVIYTSPIKALSNQKFYEFTKKYPEISFGLFTGDIKTNPEADVLIMTTEILMNYLFIQTNHEEAVVQPGIDFQINIQRDLACVVFDEVHYINDKDRGQVWEKSILMLPNHVQKVMLSATIDNPAGFAKWCEQDNDKQVYLASTTHRVVPLTHYGFLTCTEQIFKLEKNKEVQQEVKKATNKLLILQDEHGKFDDTTYSTINKTLKLYNYHRVFLKRKHVLNQLAKYLHEKEMLPAITFIFSRKLVEACAHEITVPLLEFDSKVPYTVKTECDQIIRKLPNYKEYLELPEYVNLVKLLEKGIGIHHSGMIPVLREIVELMISKKYIKLLFATESFAIGLDCPIKTAVFSNLSKFDGTSERFLMAHEYTQMAGRAGRRGIDTIGNIVHCNNLFNLPSSYEYKKMLNGKPQQLVSKFHISFDLIFNLLKNGQTKDFHLFSHKSMIKNELAENEKYHQNLLIQTTLEIEKLKTSFSVFTISEEIIQKYIELQEKEMGARQNAKRKIQDQMKKIEKEHANINKELAHYNLLTKHQTQKPIIEKDINNIQNYLKTTTNSMCDLLIHFDFIQKEEEDYSLTHRGIIASNIAEVHPLLMTEIIEKTNYFADFEPEQIVGLLSCFTNIRVNDDIRSMLSDVQDSLVFNTLDDVENLCVHYNGMEHEYSVDSGHNYDILRYDIVHFSMNWCKCKEDTECKVIFQELSEIPISVGDFNKALLKIVNIVRECINVFEIINRVDVLHKLKQIEPMVLKYVTTNQSLYV
tara:strand:+ start:6663 stop:9137 length:2475 start_codon:yes stop_codon:yes gene_type:complete